ncbi:sulfatase-like hydrolase/transferase [Uliginosibacterium sp. TH139]|uniref:sulfatase-like hydrolase/transferase n=1 Tax=Uliginosibacterium sp. TH139 TaxID=2067453 RepID=UPI000C7AC208|nr:sulfatase-like hydrolase/transferase [Uliginosibacterium sp. TH139]PLK50433.1 sulfatase [Uliginosibacterium sp. TH139]
MSTSPEQKPDSTSRRDFLQMASAAAAAPLLAGAMSSQATAAPAAALPRSAQPRTRQPNILFVFTDQERYIKQWPKGLHLPGHSRLMQRGVTFHNHYCPAVMCTSSRAVLLTGLQTADNRMFENADMPYVKALAPDVPTIGHMLRKAGYYTAYKGKWHLNAAFDTEAPDKLFTKEMEGYGFADFVWPGDVLVHTLGGYKHDHMIAGSAVSWLRETGQALQQEGKPWSLFVSLVNPHDIMYFNTDAPGESVQDNGKLMMHAARAPEHPAYRQRWNAALPANLRQPLDAPGRPAAHAEFNRAWGYTLGSIPPEDARWQRFSDFYFNSIRSVDAQLLRLLDELDALGLSEDTVIVFTSDHGEMGGAHGLRGKGPMAYQEAIHLPLIIAHPDVRGGQDCSALSGHIDLVPTLLGMAGIRGDRVAEVAGRPLPGKDLGPLFTAPGKAGLHAVRDSVLFTYSGLATNDSELTRLIAEARAVGQNPKEAVKAAGYRPNFKKRGSLRTVFDGRYKFSRYFSPLERNSPKNLDELFRWNDVELFDLQQDPQEMRNLASQRESSAALLQVMNTKLEAIIKAEIGVDDGREMPAFEGINWQIDRIDL